VRESEGGRKGSQRERREREREGVREGRERRVSE
jgi:hypothetical protein